MEDVNNFKVPEGWVETTLGNVVTLSDKKVEPSASKEVPYVGLEHIEKDTGSLLSFGKSSEVKSTKSKFNNGDLLYGKLRPYLNKVACVDFGGVCSTDILVFTKNPCISNKFLLFRLLSRDFVRYASQNVNGVQHPRVNFQTLSEFPISLPPLNEQRRLVAKIEALKTRSQRVKDALSSIPALLDQFRQSVLAAAFCGDLTGDWRSSNPDVEPADVLLKRTAKQLNKNYNEIENIDTTYRQSIPVTWTFSQLDFVLKNIQAGKNFTCPEISVNENTVGLVKISAVTWGKFDATETKTVIDESKVDPKLFINKGDFLISRANTIELVGACVVVENISHSIMISDKVWRVKFLEVESQYINYYLKSKQGRKEIESRATGNQLSMRNISQNAFKDIVIAFPPLKEQKEIVRQIQLLFKVADTIEQQYQQSKDAINQLDQSILAEAFRGALVPQDPNDEPASVLLERIRTEREKGADTSSKRSKKTKPASEPMQMELELE